MMDYIDSNYFCYLLTDNKEFADKVQAYLVQVALGEKEACTSVYTLTEVYITLKRWFKWPEKRARWAIATLLEKSNVRFLPLTMELMLEVPRLMERGFKYGDSIHIATIDANGLLRVFSEDKGFDRVNGIERLRL
jgi:predicted nucleic acid-binding protein